MSEKKENRGRRRLTDKRKQIGICIPTSRVEFLGQYYIQEQCKNYVEELYIAKGGPNV